MRDSDNNLKFVDTNYVPRLDTEGYKIYAHSKASQFELDYNVFATGSSIVQRGSNGNILMTEPVEDDAGANKAYVDKNFLSKSSTAGFKVYAHASSSQVELDYDINATGSSVVQRNAEGQVITAEPTYLSAAATKNYVDTAIAASQVHLYRHTLELISATQNGTAYVVLYNNSADSITSFTKIYEAFGMEIPATGVYQIRISTTSSDTNDYPITSMAYRGAVYVVYIKDNKAYNVIWSAFSISDTVRQVL